MRLWPFKRRVEVRTETKTVHVPCVPDTIEVKHTYGRRPQPTSVSIETRGDTGMPLRSSPVRLVGGGYLPAEVLIPKPGGGFDRHGVYLVVEYGG